MIADLAPSFGVYVHVPFCSALCPYCDFAVVVGKPELHERYLDAVVAEAKERARDARAGSLFVGGGTPTFVDPALLANALAAIRDVIPFEPNAEVTVEANPESVTEAGLAILRAAGVNRVSIGAQSFQPNALAVLGRTHAQGDIERAVNAARAAGIGNVSLDLIYGAPGETDDDWRSTLQRSIEQEPDHISCYALTIEERTAFGVAVANETMQRPDDDVLATRFDIACDVLGSQGFDHYEISNWARPGMHSLHNLVYWTQGDYLGLGLGAHSHRGGVRSWNTRRLARYLDGRAQDGSETLDDAQRAEEWLSLRMRLLEGIDVAEAQAKLQRQLPAERLEAHGLVAVNEGRLTLTRKGMLLENLVTSELIGNRPATPAV